MRKSWQIATTQRAFSKQCTRDRAAIEALALKQFEKPVINRLTPEEVIIRILGKN